MFGLHSGGYFELVLVEGLYRSCFFGLVECLTGYTIVILQATKSKRQMIKDGTRIFFVLVKANQFQQRPNKFLVLFLVSQIIFGILFVQQKNRNQ